MKNILFILLFCNMIAASQNPAISEIRNEYALIQKSLPKFIKDTQNLVDLSSEGGLATAYHDSFGKIRLITSELFGESGKVIEEYYFKNDSLFFAYRILYNYNAPIYCDSLIAKREGGDAFDHEKTTSQEFRYYFSHQKMILMLGPSNRQIKNDEKEYLKSEKEILDFAIELFKKFKI